ncbi:16S rRNA (guanine(527)-N(7))-methyltransferase RsmG [Candidatus Halobeggiatoa sp. HSG11]|nr:16S rRNA (guanine(527)-N(7))-methyltransferase RsmG [Candidatus Halobeggiatoa sp. HSG11]
MQIIDNLNKGLQSLNIDLSSANQILNYLKLLDQWNKVYNLTAVRNIEQMLPKHVFDSLTVLPYIRGTKVLDVGTGAGLPGLILAIARPDLQIVLLDSNSKKIRFVKQAIIELKIANAMAICTRTEDSNYKEEFTTVISRAYTNIYDFYTQTVKFIDKNGCLLAMKGIYPEAEIIAMKQLPVEIKSITLQVPMLPADRHLIEISLL